MALEIDLSQKLEDLKALIITQGQKKALTLEEVTSYTGLSKSYLYKLTSTGGIPCYKPHGKHIYFDRDEIDSWLLQNRNTTKAESEEAAIDYVTLNQKGGSHA